MNSLSRIKSSIPELNDFIECYWHHSFDGNLKSDKLFIPEGIFEIIFELGDRVKYKHGTSKEWTVRPSSFLGGLFDNHYRLHLNGKIELFGIRFKPGKFRHFVRQPLSHFKNQMISIEEVFGKQSNELIERTALLDSLKEKEQLMSKFLLARLLVNKRSDSLVENLVNQNSNYRNCISEAKNLKISERHLRRIFNNDVGIAPKKYFQLRRLNRLLKEKESLKKLTTKAFVYGYYDQAHFTNDVKKLTGISPSGLSEAISGAQKEFFS